MNKKFGVLLVVGLLMFLLVGTLVVDLVSGGPVGPPIVNDEGDVANAQGGNQFWLSDFLDKWEKGETIDDIVSKYLVLILIGVLIFSSLSSANFPESGILKVVLSVVVAFLSTWYLVPEELIGIFSSYTGLALVISIVFPIFLLIFLSFAITKKVRQLGILGIKALWGAYGIWLVWRGFVVIVLKYSYRNWKEIITTEGILYNGSIDWLNLPGVGILKSAQWIGVPVSNMISETALYEALRVSTTIAVMFLVIGIIIFWMGVVRTAWIHEWLKKTERETVVSNFKDEMKKAKSFIKEASGMVEEDEVKK